MINIITTVAGRKTSSVVMGLGRCLSSVTGATSAAKAARSSRRYHKHIKLQSFAFSSKSSSSNSNDPNSSVDDSNDENPPPPPPSPSSPRPPMPLFPWRHETTPLPRLVEGTPEFTSLGPMLTSIRKLVPGNARLNSAASAFMFLDVPWYEILWLSHFEADLSDNISWAFAKGVGELLCLLPLKSSSTNDEGGGTGYSGSNSNNSDKELGSVDFHHTINLIDAATESVEAIGKATVPNENDNEITSNSSVSDNFRETLETMFEEKMIEYYLSLKDNALAELLTSGSASSATADSKSSDSAILDDDSETTFDPKDEQIEFRLLMEPYQSELISLYSIPYMSRKLASDDPNYLIFYRNMLSKPSRERAPDLSMLRSEYLDGQGRMESTVIAQVLVWCHEIFYVKHLASGKILQGQEVMYSSSNNSRQEHDSSQDHTDNDDNTVNSNNEDIHQVRQPIPHLVRMEKTVITFKDAITGSYANSQGDWMITDIDDVLGGNFVV